MHVIHDLICNGFAYYPPGRRAIITLFAAMQSLLELDRPLGRIERKEVHDFLDDMAHRINHRLE